MQHDKKLYWERRKQGLRGQEDHPNYVKPYGIVIRERRSKLPLKSEKVREFPKRTSKKDRRTLRTV